MILSKVSPNNYAQSLSKLQLFEQIESISCHILQQDNTLNFALVSVLNTNLSKLVSTQSDKRKLQRIIINFAALLTNEQYDIETRIRGIEMMAERQIRIIKSETDYRAVNVTFYICKFAF